MNIRKAIRVNFFLSELYYRMHMDDIAIMLGSKTFERKIDKAIKKFLPEYADMSGEEIRNLRDDIKQSYYVCKANPEEYFLLGLKDCDNEQKRQFVTDKFLYRTMGKYASRKKHDEEIEDKYNFYLLAKDFFGGE